MHFFFARRFFPLFVTQFLGAFNDNLFKNALVVLVTYRLAAESGGNARVMVALAGAVFILPYFLFSALAGQLADKIERTRLIRVVKLVEIGLMVLVIPGFFGHHGWFLMAVLFGMGVHSTFFGPLKYALLPQHLSPAELLSGNAAIEAGTFLSILLGTMAGGGLVMLPGGDLLVPGLLIIVALGGFTASLKIPPAPAPDPGLVIHRHIFAGTWRLMGLARADRGAFRAILGISWFWFIGASFLAQFPSYGHDILHGDAGVVTLFLTVFSIGIGLGSLLCNGLFKGRVTLRYGGYALLGLSVFAADLSFASAHPVMSPGLQNVQDFLSHAPHWQILADLLGVAICGGVYIVPLYTFLQQSGKSLQLARLIAANNVMNALYMVGSALLLMLLATLHVTIPQIFIVVAVANLAMAFMVLRSYPE